MYMEAMWKPLKIEVVFSPVLPFYKLSKYNQCSKYGKLQANAMNGIQKTVQYLLSSAAVSITKYETTLHPSK